MLISREQKTNSDFLYFFSWIKISFLLPRVSAKSLLNNRKGRPKHALFLSLCSSLSLTHCLFILFSFFLPRIHESKTSHCITYFRSHLSTSKVFVPLLSLSLSLSQPFHNIFHYHQAVFPFSNSTYCFLSLFRNCRALSLSYSLTLSIFLSLSAWHYEGPQIDLNLSSQVQDFLR